MRKRGRWWVWGVGFAIAYSAMAWTLYRVESTHPEGRIRSLADAFWYLIVTLTTVGYGDIYPVTTAGRFIGAVFVISSLGFLGYFVGAAASVLSEYRERKRMGEAGTDFEQHVVILGWNPFSNVVVEKLLAGGIRAAVLVSEKEQVELIYDQFSSDDVFVLLSETYGAEDLNRANVRESRLILVNLGDDADNLIKVLSLRKHFPSVDVVVSVENDELLETFYDAGVTYALSRRDLASQLIATYVAKPEQARVSEELLFAREDNGHVVETLNITDGHHLVDEPYPQLFERLIEKDHCVPLGILRGTFPERRMTRAPDPEMRVEPGDILILFTTPASPPRDRIGTTVVNE